MTLPTFLGLGAPKTGSTWVHNLLTLHPEVFFPGKAKEVRFFNHFYDQGLDWYEGFFPTGTNAEKYKAFGEFTRTYIYCEECPKRIANDLVDPKLFLTVRNPVDRAWSHYRYIVRHFDYRKGFKECLVDYPRLIDQGLYSPCIKRYHEYFDPDRLLILVFDDIFSDIENTKTLLAEYLGIDPEGFPAGAGQKVENKGFMPKHRTTYSVTFRLAKFALDRRMQWPYYVAKKAGIKRLIGSEGEPLEPMSDELRQELIEIFDPEITEMETLLQKDLSHWRE